MYKKLPNGEWAANLAQLAANATEARYASPRACRKAEQAAQYMRDLMAVLADAAMMLREDAAKQNLLTPTIEIAAGELIKAGEGLEMSAMHLVGSGMALKTEDGRDLSTDLFSDLKRH